MLLVVFTTISVPGLALAAGICVYMLWLRALLLQLLLGDLSKLIKRSTCWWKNSVVLK